MTEVPAAGRILRHPDAVSLTRTLSNLLRRRFQGGVVAHVLTPEQQETVRFFRALNVPAAWFVGEPDEAGTVEVVALSDVPRPAAEQTEGFIWVFRIERDGTHSANEAVLGEFHTGINC
jgi:hypothetical protein